MKKLNFKKSVATTLSKVAILSARTSSGLCDCFTFSEPKMPKSLYKRD